jgi:hypothetical protein
VAMTQPRAFLTRGQSGRFESRIPSAATENLSRFLQLSIAVYIADQSILRSDFAVNVD